MHLLVQVCFVLAILVHAYAEIYPECNADEGDFNCYTMKRGHLNLRSVGPTDVLSESNVALMKIHAYSEKNYRVILQNLQNDVSSIEFKMKDEHLFSCSKETVGNTQMNVFKVGKNKIEKKKEESSAKLQCDVEFNAGSPIITNLQGGPFKFVAITPVATLVVTISSLAEADTFYHCDPNQLKYKLDNIHKTKAYRKVHMDLNKVICSDTTMYNKLEYRTDDSSEYVEMTSLECKKIDNVPSRKFVLNGNAKYIDDDINVRCVGEAKFFCDYDPKFLPDKEPMRRIKPNKALGTPSMIECPNSHPFFTIKGRAPVSKNYTKFECLNYKGDMMWTMDKDIISPTYPEVYCTDTKECEKVHSSLLHSGSYINEENVPACHEGGQLWINKESAEKCIEESTKCLKVDKFVCDTRVGILAYTKLLDETTFKFRERNHVFCDYPKTARQVNRKNMQTIIICATVSGVGTFIVTLVVMFFVLRRIHRRQIYEMEKLKKIDEAEAKKYRDGKFNGLKFNPCNLEDDKSKKSKRDSINSGNGTVSTKRSMVEKDKLSVKEKGRGFFSDKNERPLVEIEAPNGKSEIRNAYRKNEETRFRTDGFPKGYKMEYNPETRPFMEKTIQCCNEGNEEGIVKEGTFEAERRRLVKMKEDKLKKLKGD